MEIIVRLRKWLGEKPYTKAMYLTAIATIVMAGMSAVMCYTLIQNREALALTARSVTQSEQALAVAHQSLDLEQAEFRARNRPLVVIGSHEFSGPAGDSAGHSFPHSVKTHLVNVSEIPATQVQGTFQVRLNGVTIGTPHLAPIAVAKDTTRTLALGLTEQMYDAARSPSNTFEATTELTYSGMLGEKSDAYLTRVTVYWSVQDQHFISKEVTYR